MIQGLRCAWKTANGRPAGLLVAGSRAWAQTQWKPSRFRDGVGAGSHVGRPPGARARRRSDLPGSRSAPSRARRALGHPEPPLQRRAAVRPQHRTAAGPPVVPGHVRVGDRGPPRAPAAASSVPSSRAPPGRGATTRPRPAMSPMARVGEEPDTGCESLHDLACRPGPPGHGRRARRAVPFHSLSCPAQARAVPAHARPERGPADQTPARRPSRPRRSRKVPHAGSPDSSRAAPAVPRQADVGQPYAAPGEGRGRTSAQPSVRASTCGTAAGEPSRGSRSDRPRARASQLMRAERDAARPWRPTALLASMPVPDVERLGRAGDPEVAGRDAHAVEVHALQLGSRPPSARAVRPRRTGSCQLDPESTEDGAGRDRGPAVARARPTSPGGP